MEFVSAPHHIWHVSRERDTIRYWQDAAVAAVSGFTGGILL